MDMESLRYPSWCLSRLLDKVIDTEEVVALRRKRRAMLEYVKDVNIHYKQFYSGSRGEGFFWRTSDYDYMIIHRDTLVVESINNIRPSDSGKTALLLTREGCNPGFFVLQLLNKTNDPKIRESVVEYRGHPVVSSLLYRDAHRNADFYQVGHGPCNTVYNRVDVDIANGFECDRWPAETNEFIFRARPYGWPTKSLLDKIISRGCHVVPVGDKNPDLSHIQWRLSFSVAEKNLIHSFNHTQFLVYGLMKIFLKQFINKFKSVEDLVCSYFLKTAVFYSIESTPSLFWRDDLLILCFWYCLNKLIQWVEQGHCPNYFVPQNNMFRGKVFGQNQRNLLTVLDQCKRSGWTCIFLCKDLQSLENIVNHPELLYSSGPIPSRKRRESYSDIIVCCELYLMYITDLHMIPRHLARALTLFCCSRTQHEKDISTMMLYYVRKRIVLMNTCIKSGIGNKDKYRKTHHMLLTTAASNICTWSLYLATFYYMVGQYKKAVHVCDRVISLWKPYVLYRSLAHKRIYNIGMYERYVCCRGITVFDKMRSANASDIFIDPAVKDFYPAELHYDIESSAPFGVDIPPIPYTVFLLFLCHHKLGNIDQSVTGLNDLQVLIRDEQQGCRDYPIVLNMLAVCQEKLGDVHGAVETCLLSQKLKPDKNGAEKKLEEVLRQYF